MKKTLVSFIFLLASSFNVIYGQIVTPEDEPVCPNQVEGYKIKSGITGKQRFELINGVFVVPDSLYLTSDSTIIGVDINSSNDSIYIKWGDNSRDGELQHWEGPSFTTYTAQDFEIGIVDPPSIHSDENMTILNGTHYFNVVLTAHKTLDYHDEYSSNITRTDRKRDRVWTDLDEWIFTYKITGDQSGWIRFRTSSAFEKCGSNYSQWDSVLISRKLNPPAFNSIDYLLCHEDVAQYSITPDPNVESYTWNVSSGLKILIDNTPVSSHTGNETNVTIEAQTFGSGERIISVKANGANGYADSDETTKEIWLDKPTTDKIIYYNVGPYYPGSNDICLDSPNDGKALYENSKANILEYEWDALDWTIAQHPNDPFPQTDMQDVQITAPPYGYSPGDPVYISISARNTCGWSEWKYPKLELECVNCGYFIMSVYPNPADSYVELTLTENREETGLNTSSETHQVKIQKNKDYSFNSLDNISVQIFDEDGNIRKTTLLKSSKIKFDTRDLEAGKYYLHIKTDENVYKQQLIIK